MKLTKFELISASKDGDNTTITLKTNNLRFAPLMLRDEITAFSTGGFTDLRLKTLYEYLIDRPSLMDDKEVRGGVASLKEILGLA